MALGVKFGDRKSKFEVLRGKFCDRRSNDEGWRAIAHPLVMSGGIYRQILIINEFSITFIESSAKIWQWIYLCKEVRAVGNVVLD